MSDVLIACLSTHLPYIERASYEELRRVLQSGCPPRRALNELSDGPLRSCLRMRPDVWDWAERTREWCMRHHASILYPTHPAYPPALEHLQKPPHFLSLWGEPVWWNREGIGVVGSREPSRQALEWMDEHLPHALRATSAFTVSGGARGIDQKAHAMSLRADIPTVAFLPSGLARIYPADFHDWIAPIRERGGAILSEFSPGAEMHKGHFQRRNRMIATLGCGLFVVEAARKSGSLMTARLALEAGRQVCVLPASPLQSKAMGTVDLLFDGASPVRDGRDLAEFIRFNARRGED